METLTNFASAEELARPSLAALDAQIKELEAELHECSHPRQRPTLRRIKNGTLQVWGQCPDCGANTGARRKADYDLDALPWWDDELPTRRGREMQRLGELRWARYQAEREAEKEDFNERYAAYRKTDHWQRLRRRALTRDKFLCQNCFCEVNALNSVAHHKLPWGYDTLRRLGYSMTFEVETLCLKCHAEAHGLEP